MAERLSGGEAIMDLEKRAIRSVTMRLVPFLVLCYFIAYLDRVNVGFAKLTMSKSIGLTETAFGLGAGIFFLAYFIFELPSNLMLERFGARRWIARIMVTWGILSGCMAFIVGEKSFYLVRVLLGFAEAGFFPGVIFYLTLWFPAKERARIIGLFMAAIPLSSVIGAPVSSHLLGLDGLLGLQGWQWLYIVEAGAGADPGRRRALLSDRQAGRRDLAKGRRARLAGQPAGGGAAGQGHRAAL